MAIVKYRLDPKNLPPIDKEAFARIDSLTEEEINERALSDPDNPPMTDDELSRMERFWIAKQVRKATKLSQAEFAHAYHFSLGRLRDLEQGRTFPDTAIRAYLKLIEADPEGVRAKLGR